MVCNRVFLERLTKREYDYLRGLILSKLIFTYYNHTDGGHYVLRVLQPTECQNSSIQVEVDLISTALMHVTCAEAMRVVWVVMKNDRLINHKFFRHLDIVPKALNDHSISRII